MAHSGRLFAATGQWEYSGPFGVRTGPGQEVKDQSVDGLRADAVPSGPGVGLLSDSERSGSRARPFPPRHPSDRRRAVEDPVVARRRQVLLPPQFVRSPRGRRRPCVRGARVGRGLVRLRRGPPDGGPPRSLVTHSPHLGVQSQTRAHRGPARVAGCGDAEGHGLRRLRRSPVLHHQHDALSAQRRRPALRCSSLGPGVPSATGRAAQQRAPGHHVPHPRRVTVAPHLDGGQRQRVPVRPSPTGPARYHGDARARVRSPTGWCRRSSSNPSPPSVRCWRLRERSSRQRDEVRSSTSSPPTTTATSRPSRSEESIGRCSGSSGATRESAQRRRSVDRSPQAWCTSTPAPASQSGPIRGQSPTYALRCLSGPTVTPIGAGVQAHPLGQAFVSIRSIVPSPFADGRIYYGGYDCNFYPADGTAWVATSTLSSLASPFRRKEDVMKRPTRSPRRGAVSPIGLGLRRRPGAGAQRLQQLALAASRLSRAGERRPDRPLRGGVGYPQDQAHHRDRAGEPIVRQLLRDLPGRRRHPDEEWRADGVRAHPDGRVPSALSRHGRRERGRAAQRGQRPGRRQRGEDGRVHHAGDQGQEGVRSRTRSTIPRARTRRHPT